MRPRSLALALFAIALAVPAGAQAPTASTLVPVSTATVGKPVPIAVVLEGLGEQAPVVTLFYRNRSVNAWGSAPMALAAPGRYQGEVPAAESYGLAVRYYVLAKGSDDSWKVSLGSADNPLSVDLLEAPAAASSSTWGKAGGTALLVAMVAGFAAYRERRHRNTVLDRAFWLRTLAPLHGLPGPKLAQEIRRLCGTPLSHPVRGLTIFPRTTITQKLYEVGGWNERELERELSIFAPEMKLARLGEQRTEVGAAKAAKSGAVAAAK